VNLRLIVAGATVAGAVSVGSLLLGTGAARADPAAPPLPAEQAAASDPATPDGDNQKDQQQQAEPVHDNGLPWPLSSLDLPPAPFDVPPPPPLNIPPPVQVTVPVGVSLGLPAIPLGLPLPQLPPPPAVPLPPGPQLPTPPSIPLPPPPSIPLPPPPF
jgi:hypothetical protein